MTRSRKFSKEQAQPRATRAPSSFLDDRGEPLNLAPDDVLHTQLLDRPASSRVQFLRWWWIGLLAVVVAFILVRKGLSGWSLSVMDVVRVGCYAALMVGLQLLVRRANRSKTHPSSSRLASFLAAHRHCGACGYDLHQISPETDQCCVCPECGGAWHESRFVWSDRSLRSAPGLALLMSRGHDAATDHDCDDRGVPTPGGNRWPPRWYEELTAGPLRSRIQAHLRTKRRSIASFVWSGAIMFWLGSAALFFAASFERGWDTAVLILGVTFIIVALITLMVWRMIENFWMRRWAVDALHLCNNCGNELPVSDPLAFDGCFACTKCGHAWKPRVDRHARAGNGHASGVPAEQS